MKNKIIGIIGIIIIILGILFIERNKIISYLISSQYNSHGVSHFLVITIDKNQEKEYLGKLEDHDIYMEQLSIKETVFRTIDAKNLSIKEALEKELVSIEDWRKYATNIKKEKDYEIFQYENYEIIVSKKECLIRPR